MDFDGFWEASWEGKSSQDRTKIDSKRHLKLCSGKCPLGLPKVWPWAADPIPPGVPNPPSPPSLRAVKRQASRRDATHNVNVTQHVTFERLTRRRAADLLFLNVKV